MMKHLFSCLMLMLTLSTPVLAVNNDQSYLEQSIPAVEDEDLRIILNETLFGLEPSIKQLYLAANRIISNSEASYTSHDLVNALKNHLKQPIVEQKFFKYISHLFKENEIKDVSNLIQTTSLKNHLVEIRDFQ